MLKSKHHAPLVCALVAAVALSATAGGASAQEWRSLGPTGGYVHYLATSPSDPGSVYAAIGPRIFASADTGGAWIERTPASECPSPLSLQVRANGDLFINCYHRNLRSRDGGLSWSTYSPTSRWLTDFRLAFDPHQPSRAAVRRMLNEVWQIAMTSDDGLTWTAPVPGPNDVVPTYIAFDPVVPGRLVGVATESRYVNGAAEYQTRFHESRDDGAHWTPVSTIVAQGTYPCYEREFVAGTQGRLFLLADCGFLRSRDGGVTWEFMPRARELGLTQFQVDASNPGRLLALDNGGQLHESRDAAVSWQALPGISRAVSFTTAANGTVLASTEEGVLALLPGASQWVSRSVGLHARPIGRVEPAGSASTALAAWGTGQVQFRSVDSGVNWSPFGLNGRAVADLTRSLHDANAVFAMTDDGALHASTDAGSTWTLVNPRPSLGANDPIAGIVAVPGVLYGVVYETCGANVLPPPCQPIGRGVARSTDGGKSWTRAAGGLELGQGGYVSRLVGSPASPSALIVQTSSGLFATFDGGMRFTHVLSTGGWATADPSDPLRWYVIDFSGKLLGTADGGASWSALTAPPVFAGRYDLLVDPHDPRRLYAVGQRGDVSASDDRGVTWAIVVPPSLSLDLTLFSARVGPEAATTIYAGSGQGVVTISLAGVTAPAIVRAIEYYRPAVDHYFVTADPREIAKLDSGATAGWLRTGFGFDVLAGTASATLTSSVCRFYGRPEKGLDSHFYSAAPAECQAVLDRFGDTWIHESAAVFRAYLPAASDGLCPSRTTPVYRLYNKRADVNHRYTMWPELRQNMLDAGWIAEGYGPYGVAMCAPW